LASHRVPLECGDDGVSSSGEEYESSKASDYGAVIDRVLDPVQDSFKFHWYWFPFGFLALLLGVYGLFLLIYALSGEGPGIILFKGLGLCIGGWCVGVFCFFHWLYQQWTELMKQPEYTEGTQALENFKSLANAILQAPAKKQKKQTKKSASPRKPKKSDKN
jgi:hypothetical protein